MKIIICLVLAIIPLLVSAYEKTDVTIVNESGFDIYIATIRDSGRYNNNNDEIWDDRVRIYAWERLKNNEKTTHSLGVSERMMWSFAVIGDDYEKYFLKKSGIESSGFSHTSSKPQNMEFIPVENFYENYQIRSEDFNNLFSKKLHVWDFEKSTYIEKVVSNKIPSLVGVRGQGQHTGEWKIKNIDPRNLVDKNGGPAPRNIKYLDFNQARIEKTTLSYKDKIPSLYNNKVSLDDIIDLYNKKLAVWGAKGSIVIALENGGHLAIGMIDNENDNLPFKIFHISEFSLATYDLFTKKYSKVDYHLKSNSEMEADFLSNDYGAFFCSNDLFYRMSSTNGCRFPNDEYFRLVRIALNQGTENDKYYGFKKLDKIKSAIEARYKNAKIPEDFEPLKQLH